MTSGEDSQPLGLLEQLGISGSHGMQVGYAVRFDDTSTHETKIRYVTDGLLLREAVADPLLQQYKAGLSSSIKPVDLLFYCSSMPNAPDALP